MLELNRCYNIDCMHGLVQFPDKYFDLAVVDPPYFSGPEKRGFYGRRDSGILGRRVDYEIDEEAWTVPNEQYFKELFRVSKRYIVWGCNYFNCVFAPGRIVWDKCNGKSSFSDCEIAATNVHDSVRLFRYMWNGMMQGKSISEGFIQRGNKRENEKRIHPTQKPIELYDWIFERYARPGFKIVDTHLGSGSSRISAHKAGLNFIGFEKSRDMFEKEELRFNSFVAQQSMFY